MSEAGTVEEEAYLSKWAKSDCGNEPSYYAEIKGRQLCFHIVREELIFFFHTLISFLEFKPNKLLKVDTRAVCCSGAGVIQAVKLAVEFVGGIVFDALECERPASSQSGHSSPDSPPVSKVSFATMVVHVAGLVDWRGNCPAFAFGSYVVKVKLRFGNGAVAEVTRHVRYLSFFIKMWFLQRTAFRLENGRD